jgi:RHS repeat-associated protein
VAETTSSGWQVGYGYLGSQLLTEYENSTTYFFLRDHLGSTRLMTKADGTVYDSMDYLPYGEQAAGNAGTTHKFTAKERDGETGLDYFGARYYTGAIGRFITPDDLFHDQAEVNPQSWNLYSYVRNNPLRFIDPDGHKCVTLKGANGNVVADDGIGALCDHMTKARSGWVADAEARGGGLSQDERILLLSMRVTDYTSPHNLADTASKAGLWASMLRGLGGAIRGYLQKRAIATAAAEMITGPFGSVSVSAIEAAAADGGEAITVVTNLTAAPEAGQALSVATGEGAEALANAAGALRGGGQLFTAQIPKALVEVLKKAGLARETITDIGGHVAHEIRFAPSVTRFIAHLFK